MRSQLKKRKYQLLSTRDIMMVWWSKGSWDKENHVQREGHMVVSSSGHFSTTKALLTATNIYSSVSIIRHQLYY